MKRTLKYVVWFWALLVALPIAVGSVLGYAKGWPESYRTASWDSTGLLPAAAQSRPARVMILAARTGRWKGIFAEHTWIVLKPEGARAWQRYDVVGWGTPVRRDAWAADAFWYGNRPRAVKEITGPEAAALIPGITAAIAAYPHDRRGDYVVWPGPNSNTFVAWVVRAVDGLEVELPAMAVGKDYLGGGLGFARAPSGTGWDVSIAGVIGGTLAWEEGIELHLLGSTIGIDANDAAIKLPGLGKLGFL